MASPCGTSSTKKPIASRFLAPFLVAAAICVESVARAEEPAPPSAPAALTEAEALRRGLARPALRDAIAADADLARADETAAGIWPNPVLSYSHEETYGSTAASSEDYAFITQSIDVSGRRGLRVDAAGRRVDAAALRGASRRAAVAAEIRMRFYTVLHVQKRVAAIEVWLVRTSSASDTVGRRERAGDVSGYDRLRLERERASARARLDLEHAALERGRARLASVVGSAAAFDPSSLRVAGDLLPSSPLAPLGTAVARAGSHPDLGAIAAEAEAAELEGDAADRAWVPDLALGGGVKTVGLTEERVTGFLVVASLSLPIFDRDQDEALRAAARARAARARLELERTELAGETRGAWVESSALAEAARRFRTESVPAAADVVRTAEAAYAGGEIGILELLDAYRGALEAELGALELEWGARRARIELDRALGGAAR
jgi:cobalt-zinc-cadmium efflux system outer membrane protein